MTIQKLYLLLGLTLVAQQSFAGDPIELPLEMGGGIAAVAALSLIIAAQLIKRRK